MPAPVTGVATALVVIAPALAAQHRGGRGYRGRPSASRLHGHRVRGDAPSLAAPRRRPSSPRRPLGPAQGPAAELPPVRDARPARPASVQRRGPARVHAADGAPTRLARIRDRPPNPAQLRRGRPAGEHAGAGHGGGRGQASSRDYVPARPIGPRSGGTKPGMGPEAAVRAPAAGPGARKGIASLRLDNLRGDVNVYIPTGGRGAAPTPRQLQGLRASPPSTMSPRAAGVECRSRPSRGRRPGARGSPRPVAVWLAPAGLERAPGASRRRPPRSSGRPGWTGVS